MTSIFYYRFQHVLCSLWWMTLFIKFSRILYNCFSLFILVSLSIFSVQMVIFRSWTLCSDTFFSDSIFDKTFLTSQMASSILSNGVRCHLFRMTVNGPSIFTRLYRHFYNACRTITNQQLIAELCLYRIATVPFNFLYRSKHTIFNISFYV